MGQNILLKRSAIPGKKPTTSSLNLGEIALNTYDGLAFIKKSGSLGEEIVAIGASNISGSTNFIPIFSGSTDLINSTIFQSGSFTAIGATSSLHPNNPETLLVNSLTDSYNLISGHANIDNYVQLNIKNFSGGLSASSDIVATADIGDEESNYINMGINGSNYAAGNAIGGALDAYLYNTGENLYIGNTAQSKQIVFFNGGFDVNANAALVIHDQGTISINTTEYNEANPPSLAIQAPRNLVTNTLIEGVGDTDQFLQLAISNKNSGSFASSDIVAYNNLDPTNQGFGFIDMGINSTNFDDPTNYPGWTSGHSYVYSDAPGMIIGSISGSSQVNIFAGGNNPITNSKLVIRANNTHSLTGSLQVTGSITGSNDFLINGITIGRGSGNVSTNVVIGTSAASVNDTGKDSVVIGYEAGKNLVAFMPGNYADSVLIGFQAGYSQTTVYDTVAIGWKAGFANVTGKANTYLGTSAGLQQDQGNYNIFVGPTSGVDFKSGSQNTIIGYNTFRSVVSGSFNTILGSRITGLPTTVNNNIILADGQGNIKYRWDGVQNTISGGLNVTGGSITGSNVLITGTITAQTLIVQTVSSSVVYASGSNIFGNNSTNTHQFTGSVLVTGSVTATSFIGDGSQITNIPASSVTGLNLYRIASGSVTASVERGAFTVNSNTEISGTLRVSSSISASNINVGVPTSNDWGANLQGSYFNNFTTQTNVSEILRFIAGLLSSSAPDTSPNTKTFGSISSAAVNTTTGTAPVGSIPQSSTNNTIIYLNSKGFATAGSTIFNGVGTIYNSNFGYNYTSVAAGTTTVSSSVDAQLFGLGNLSSGVPTSFNVSGSFTFRFKNNSTKTDTATSASQVLITQTGAGTTNGVSLAKINTINTAVIPPAYQDGKFASTLLQYLYSGSATAVSASGYYHISASVRIASGSSTYSNVTSANAEIFWAPTTTISSNITAQTPATGSTISSSITAISRSLSGAPYLSSATYTISSSITNPFNPMYYAGAGIASITLTGTGMSATSGINTVTTAGGTIGTANAVYDSTGTTVRATSTIPFETDIIKVNGLYTLSTANITNIGQSSNTPTTFVLAINGINKDGTTTTKNNTLPYHLAGTFAQPSASGSLAYYTRTQGADTATTSGSSNSEPFTGENYRIQLTDAILSFTGLQWSTVFGLYNLSGNDLQVKPGYLVKPGGTYGYWLADPDTTKTYKYYVRQITTNGGTKTSMTLNVGRTLVNWGVTTNNAIGALILFQSSKTPTYATARLYDPSDLLSNFVATKTANTNGQNPFGSNFDLYGNTGGSLASTTYTIPLRSADGMTLDTNNTNIYVILRYNGDPTPITSMTVAFA
jgi:hypothetical protein